MVNKLPSLPRWYIEESKVTTQDVFEFKPNVIMLTKEEKDELNRRNREIRKTGIKKGADDE